MACFRDEDAYLAEWLEYHRMIGVDHIYLYDNDGGDVAKALIAPHAREGFVTCHPWPTLPKSRLHGDFKVRIYPHCIAHHRGECTWLMKLDIDEFLVAEGNDVAFAMRGYDPRRVRGIRVPRYDFGSSGHLEPPGDLVIAAYTFRQARFSNHKDIASTAHLDGNRFRQSSHHYRYRPLAYLRRYVREREVQTLRVHHYYTKSLAEYLRRQNPLGIRRASLEGFAQRNANDVEDCTLALLAPEVRARLSARRERSVSALEPPSPLAQDVHP